MSRFATHRNLKIDAQFTIGAEAANVINVAVQMVDRDNGNEIGEKIGVAWYLSDGADGADRAASAPDGGVAIGTDGVMVANQSSLAGTLVSEADGDIDLNITHAAGADTWYLNLIMPDGQVQTSGAITFA